MSQDTEQLPWCENCEVFAVPTDDHECGDCGGPITYREGPT